MKNLLDILISFLKNPFDENKVSIFRKHSRTVGVISNGTLLMPEEEGTVKLIYPYLLEKCNYLSRISGINIYPIPIGTRDVEEFVQIVEKIALPFSLLVMENVSLPGCLAINYRLSKLLPIPVVHEEKCIWPISVAVALINACQLAGLDCETAKIVINGVEIVGTGIARLLLGLGFKNIILHDEYGVITASNPDTFSQPHHAVLSELTNPERQEGTLDDALEDADVYIGTKENYCLQPHSIRLMNKFPIIFSLGLLEQDIKREVALQNGAKLYLDLKDINPFLTYTGIINGLLEAEAENFDADYLLPSIVKEIVSYHQKEFEKTGQVLPQFNGQLQEIIVRKIKQLLGNSKKEGEIRGEEENARN